MSVPWHRFYTKDYPNEARQSRIGDVQISKGEHAVAWVAMTAMPTTAEQPHAIIAGEKGCGGCHRIGRDEGKCDSCHTRHLFATTESRRPEACMTCHMGFDHPQWEMYSTSKHGAIYEVEGSHGDWNIRLADWFNQPAQASPLRPRAPVCATCHMPQGNHTVATAWGFLGLRLSTILSAPANFNLLPSSAPCASWSRPAVRNSEL
jgi:multi-heme cytochrome with CxxCH motif